jgi:hypothetical protein
MVDLLDGPPPGPPPGAAVTSMRCQNSNYQDTRASDEKRVSRVEGEGKREDADDNQDRSPGVERPNAPGFRDCRSIVLAGRKRDRDRAQQRARKRSL